MRQTFTLLAFIVLITSVFAQVPQKLSYQAVIRDASNQLMSNKQIGMKISILQGSIDGIEIYKEIYNPNPQTNINGLLTIEIGTGIAITGDFSIIDWTDGQHFVKTEIDPSGGTDYSIIGTSQLLSVPYALYSNTAENLLPLQKLSTNGLLSKTNNGEIKTRVITAGIGINITNGDGIGGNPVIAAKSYKVGDFAFGGIVFWVDQSGQNGLVCALNDYSSKIPWSAGTDIETFAKADGLYSGSMNTAIIISKQGKGDGLIYAALACLEFNIRIESTYFGGWYLPSVREFGEITKNRKKIDESLIANGGTALTNTTYWTSTESSKGDAYDIQVIAGGEYAYGPRDKSVKKSVRAIRAF